MNWRKLTSFINASISLLSSSLPDARTAVEDANTIIYLLRTRILPEVETMQDDAFAAVGDVRNNIVRLVLELFCVRGSTDREYLVVYICHWFQGGGLWKQSLEKSLRDFVSILSTYANEWLRVVL